jgi:alkanesulfonate monooxygenase SsuD/methylene tetrahydromethanopterin reductase-like flavin-dependent oxidoreductase (luciferase family)
VPDGDPLSLSVSERMRVERAVRNAESSSGLKFSVFLGPSEEDARAYAERLHAALDDPAHSVLVLCDPVFRVLEIVTGSTARRNLDDVECRFAAASMETSFAGGDIVGGLVLGIQQLGESSRAPRTLHANN